MGYWLAGKWHDSGEITLSITDPSLLYGATIFTTLRVFENNLFHPHSHWQAHGDRLRHTITDLHWPEPNWSEINQGAIEVAKYYPVVRITILSDGRELIIGRDLPVNLRQKQQQGIQGWVATDKIYRRPMANFKTGNYLGAWRALKEAIAQDSGEAILVNQAGHWLETATGNLWGFDGETWYTPPMSGILPGVMRSHLMHQLTLQGDVVVAEPWTLELVGRLRAIGYSNSVVGVIPFTSIMNTKLPDHGELDQTAIRRLQTLSGCCI